MLINHEFQLIIHQCKIFLFLIFEIFSYITLLIFLKQMLEDNNYVHGEQNNCEYLYPTLGFFLNSVLISC